MDQQTCLQTYSCFPFCVFKIVFGFHTLLGSLYLYYSKENFTFETDIILQITDTSFKKIKYLLCRVVVKNKWVSLWESIWKVLWRMVIHINIHTQWTLSDNNKGRGPLTFWSALKGKATRGRSFFPKGLTTKVESHMSSSGEQTHSFGKCSLGSMVPTERALLLAQEE